MSAGSSAHAGRQVPHGASTISNTDIVLVVLSDLGGGERPIDVEDVAEAAWQAVPARFSWPRHQQYPDLDAVDVTLRAAKRNDGLVTGPFTDRRDLTLRPADIAGVMADMTPQSPINRRPIRR